MIGRVLLAALLAGIAAGFILGLIQHVRISPLILAAEVYEQADDAAKAGQTGQATPCVENMPGMKMCGDDGAKEWQPAPGLERTLFTTGASMLAGAGYAAVLTGISLLLGVPISKRTGLIWGVCGFFAVTVATGAGLPPEIPGMPSAELLPRQIWWLGTIIATGTALGLIALRRETWAFMLAAVLIALPHIIGAPQPPNVHTSVPPGLAAEFASNTVAAAAIFWALIGLFSGFAVERAASELSVA